MDELDFRSKPAPTPGVLYNPAIALEFFQSAGKPESVPAGAKLFEENEKASRIFLRRAKMYLLLEGEVDLVARDKAIGSVKAGEIFGEMAPISESPRSATAVAKTPCRVIALDDKGFNSALAKKPEFALMLMTLMVARLRAMLARLDGRSLSQDAGTGSRVFDNDLLDVLARGLGNSAKVRYNRGATIVKEGETGFLMYVVVEGSVAVSIRDEVVERIGPGGVFGELAVVDHSTRMASVAAESGCALLVVNRTVFLNLMKADPGFGVSLLAAIAERVRNIASRMN